MVEESPPVDKIVKKIDFKDSSCSSLKKTSSPKLAKQRNDSKVTLGGTAAGQNCSFYLTPSSGMQTPV